jgi:hypothetical protein
LNIGNERIGTTRFRCAMDDTLKSPHASPTPAREKKGDGFPHAAIGRP